MDGLQVPFFLIKGTLLGIYRDGEQLPYDKDIDLGLLWQTDRQNLFEQFQNSSTFRVADPVDGDLQKITWNIVLEHVATEVVLDLFFVKSEGPAAWFGFDHLPEPFLWKFSAFELAPMPYRGHVFQAPKHPEQFLSEIYGPQWRIPDPYFNSVVSARNIEPKSRIIAWFYAYDRLYEQLVEGNWKKVLGCCEEIKAFETEPWLVDLSAWAKQQSKHAAFK
jgi:hypothetical protein